MNKKNNDVLYLFLMLGVTLALTYAGWVAFQ